MFPRPRHITRLQSAIALGKSPAKRRGFTLIELLVVIAIISLLVSILLPSLQKAKQLTRQVICLTRLRSIASAYFLYQADFDGRGPVGFTFGSSDSRPSGWSGWPAGQNPYGMWYGWYCHKGTDRWGNRCWALGKYLDVGSPQETKLPVACPNCEYFLLSTNAQTTYAVNAYLGFDTYLGDHVDIPASSPMLTEGIYRNLINPSQSDMSYLAYPENVFGWSPPSIDDSFLDQVSFNHEGSGNFLFFDGHAESQKALGTLEEYLNLWTWEGH